MAEKRGRPSPGGVGHTTARAVGRREEERFAVRHSQDGITAYIGSVPARGRKTLDIDVYTDGDAFIRPI